MSYSIFLHGSRRSLGAMPGAAAILEKIIALAPGGLEISRPLFDEIGRRRLVRLPSVARAIEAGMPVEADLALSLGGDGTFLRTAQWVGDSQTPILGVNAGHLGFLADMSPDELLELTVDELRCLKTEPRRVLKVACSLPLPDDCWPYALNDVALLKTDTASMISIEARVDGRVLTTYQADGLVISTPTGSTGYNLSVGGPILEPTVDLVLLSPVAPHQLAMRPLGVGGRSRLEFAIESRSGQFMLSLDGRSRPLPAGCKVFVEPAPFMTVVAQKPDHHFAATLRTKLLWGERPVRQ